MKRIPAILGIEFNKVSHAERLISGLGAFAGIFFTYLVSREFISEADTMIIVASMGASAVLLFGAPHSPLGQPWSLVGGHMVSALAGVTCAQAVDDIYIAAPLAVGLAVSLMHYFRCIHPPGGASALMAVIGGASVHKLGYGYVLTPVMLNTAIILTVGILFNAAFPWRRYPAWFKRKPQSVASVTEEIDQRAAIAHEDFVYALSQMDSFIDVSEDDLLTIYELATSNSVKRGFQPSDLQLGHYYSNGKYGSEWAVRQIIDWQGADESSSRLIYKTVAGDGRRTTGVASLTEFARWVKYEVYRDEENWRRLDATMQN